MSELKFCEAGECNLSGYVGEMVRFPIENQLLDRETWALFVNQFRVQEDSSDNGWRGEFWGKMMRGGALTYRAGKNEKLYAVLEESVRDMLSAQEKSGRLSSYKEEKQFFAWDMWVRKYAMLGLLYFYEICKSKQLKEQIVACVKGQADYIIAHIGKGKTEIFQTSAVWGALNSCSILEAFVKLYRITGEARYFDFSSYIVESGFCAGENLIDVCLNKQKYPYEFAFTKAYEMMSCFEGLLEFYKITKNKAHLKAVKNFVDMVIKTDYTVVGSSGCTHELFDHSSLKQAYPTEEVMQETCVTVTFLKLCARLLLATGDSKYADCIERSAFNALFGAINSEKQTMARSEGRVWANGGMYTLPHESYPFDSYSPLIESRRARRVGGFKTLQNGRTYGCCACIGSAGTALTWLSAVMKNRAGFVINLYHDCTVQSAYKQEKVSLAIKANLYREAGASVQVKGGGKQFCIALRVPVWAENFKVLVNGEAAQGKKKGGYFAVTRAWENDEISLCFDMPVKAHRLHGRIAFTRGPIALCFDERLADVKKPLVCDYKNGESVPAKVTKNKAFYSNVAVEIPTANGAVTLCDYAQAGKNYDEENCNLTVWQKVRKA